MNEHRLSGLPNSVLENRFHFADQEYAVRLDDETISWVLAENEEKPHHYVQLKDVLVARSATNDHYFMHNQHLTRKKSKCINSTAVLDTSHVKQCHSFEIHYVVCRRSKCKIVPATFCHPDPLVVTKWLQRVEDSVRNVTNRPKSLLVFLNPYSGRKKASEIYRKYVEPLFRLAGVDVTLVLTERANHVYEYLLKNGWQNADGIVSVGGDGTFSEMINGIVARSANDENINLNDSPRDMLPFSRVRVGVVPAGSTDTIAYSLHGTSDVRTAVVHIIAGDFIKTDVCSVHSEKGYECSFISLMSYGYLGDVIKNSIGLRWMGPIRYDCAGARNFILHNSYEGTVSFLKEPYHADESSCICSKNNCHCIVEPSRRNADEAKWELIRGEFFMVTAANISCACSRSPNGIAPYCHFSDGYFNLLLIRRVTFCEKLKLLFTLSNKRRLVNNLDFVEIYRTRCFKFETGYGSGVIPATKISSWNIDGELIQTPHLFVQCHQQLMNMFCRRQTTGQDHR